MPHVSNYNFSKDKVLGDEAEEELLIILQKMYPNSYRIPGKESKYDIIVPASDRQAYHNDATLNDLTFEVKNDLRSASTGNLAIETGRVNGTLSGITVSKADYWAIRSNKTFFLAKRDDLVDYVFNPTNNFREVNGGDNNNTTMKLVPLAKIRQQAFFKEIYNEQNLDGHKFG